MNARFFTLLSLAVILALLPALTTSAQPSAAVLPAALAADAELSAAQGAEHLVFLEADYDSGLQGPTAVASPYNFPFLFVASFADNALVALQLDSTTGQTEFRAKAQDGVDGVDGLAGASAVAAYGDYLGDVINVYVAGRNDDAVAHFLLRSGDLVFVEVEKNGIGGVTGLGGASAVATSPWNNVYVTGYDDDAVAVFSVDNGGELTFMEAWVDNTGGVNGLDGAQSVAVSPDGRNVYVAGYLDNAVAVFSRNWTTGALTFLEMEKDGVGGVDGLQGAYSVAVSVDGSRVYVAGNGDDAVAVFDRDGGNGTLAFAEVVKDGVGGVNDLDGVRAVAIFPSFLDNHYVFTASYEDDAVAVFYDDPADGHLKYRDSYSFYFDPGLTSLAFSSATTPYLHVTRFSENAVATFSLTDQMELGEQPSGFYNSDGLDGATAVAVQPEFAGPGFPTYVYVSSNDDDAVAVFGWMCPPGGKAWLDRMSWYWKDGVNGVDGLDGARSVAISPGSYDVSHVYVAGNGDDAIAIFHRTSYVGMVRDGVGGVDGLDGVQAVIATPDGQNVYAAGYVDDAVAVFSRSLTTGALTFLEVKKDGVGGVNGLDGAYAIAVSPNGRFLYAAGFLDDSVAIFGRNTADGRLTYLGGVQDNTGPVDGLDGANALTFSPDGKNLYVAGRNDDAVAAFSSNPDTGSLYHYVGLVKDGVGGVDGLDGARGLVLDPNGSFLYATGQFDDAVAVFRRDPSSGALTFLEVKKNHELLPDYYRLHGLANPNGIAYSVPGSVPAIFVASYEDDAVTTFLTYPGVVYLPLVLRN